MSKKMKIQAIKIEEVGGKKTGKSFTFEMDPKEMAKHKTEATVRKKIEEYVARSGVYKRSELGELKYSGMKEFLAEWKKMIPVVEAEQLAELDKSINNPSSRVTPGNITRLAPNEIFVFGSNSLGHHAGGAAKVACEKFGAIWGEGHGMHGKTYAIDSMSGNDAMQRDVTAFIAYAKEHTDKTFFVTPIGCGIAGKHPSEVAPMFKECAQMENVCLPASFWDVIGWPEVEQKKYNLERFMDAQDFAYPQALRELKEGQKQSHWIWYIFPQQKGLGHSYNAKFYGLDGEDEARAYLEHPELGKRLRECCRALLLHKGKDIEDIMGSEVDVLKLNTSMNLFNRVSPDDVFAEVLEAFF